MRISSLVLLAAAATLFAEPHAATAQGASSYPWCSVDSGGSGRSGGSRSCSFTSRDQCMATMSGIGGHCVSNPEYRAPAGGSSRPRSRKQSG
jgi:hypothetical protein